MIASCITFICNSFSPLILLSNTVLFPLEETSNLTRSCTKQTAPLARLKHSRGSNPVLNSINKTQRQVLFSPIANQIPENIYTQYINQNWELLLGVGVAAQKTRNFHVVSALLDSGANTIFIDKGVAEWLGLMLEALDNPIHVFNIEGSCNLAGDITHTVNLTIDCLGHREEIHAEVTNLGKNLLILGYTWLAKHNLVVDWETGAVKFTHCP